MEVGATGASDPVAISEIALSQLRGEYHCAKKTGSAEPRREFVTIRLGDQKRYKAVGTARTLLVALGFLSPKHKRPSAPFGCTGAAGDPGKPKDRSRAMLADNLVRNEVRAGWPTESSAPRERRRSSPT